MLGFRKARGVQGSRRAQGGSGAGGGDSGIERGWARGGCPEQVHSGAQYMNSVKLSPLGTTCHTHARLQGPLGVARARGGGSGRVMSLIEVNASCAAPRLLNYYYHVHES